jgi:hypothetical protein
MKPIHVVASTELVTGWLLLRRPSRALQLLGYPHDRPLARATVRVLGVRQLVQGAAELRGGAATARAGACIDVAHALTCLVYAHRSRDGLRAGRRSSALALALAAAQAAAECRAASSPPGAREPGRAPEAPRRDTRSELPRVTSATAAAWPEPSPGRQQVQVVEAQREVPVMLRGGVMDGAVVAVPPGTEHYDIIDSDRGPQRYRETRERDEAGRVLFARGGEDRP